MKNYTVKKYNSQDFDNWNAFISNAKNATFLFHRNFMEYHAERFEDFSLMVFDDEKLVAVLPANKVADEVFSHQGLTYGGLVYKEEVQLASVLEIFKAILAFLESNNFCKLHLKLQPSIYHKKPSEEVHYLLFLTNALLSRRDTLTVINLSKPFAYFKRRNLGITKGQKSNLVIKEEDRLDQFWEHILIPNLRIKHNISPVHTVDEITRLKSLFPNNIRQFNVYFNDTIVAGTTIFESETVAHVQYISANATKSKLGSLDFLYHYLITSVFNKKDFFDFGVSNVNQGRNLNGGLSYWKESFGASTIVQDFYKVETNSHLLLEHVIL